MVWGTNSYVNNIRYEYSVRWKLSCWRRLSIISFGRPAEVFSRLCIRSNSLQ